MHTPHGAGFEHPEQYDRSAGRVTRRLHARIARDVAALGLPPGARVVDVGTGPGRLTAAIAAAAPELDVVGVDVSEPMIAFAREHAGGGRFEVGDVAALPFPDGSVDLVVSTLSQHHWPDPAAGYRDLARAVRPGGTVWVHDARWKLDVPAARAAFPGATISTDRVPGLLGLLLRRLTIRA